MKQARLRPIAKFISAVLALAPAMALLIQAPAAQAMTFQTVSGPPECAERSCVLATGTIDRAAVGAFRAYVRNEHIAPGAVVVLDSEGGVLLFGIQLGEEIRKAGLDTAVNRYEASAQAFTPADCASACVFTFLGGVRREVAPGSRVGVHQMYSNLQARDGISVGDVQLLTSLTAMHIDNMGGSVGILVEALRTPPQAIHWFSDPELTRLAVTTRRRVLTVASN